mmetsp:Transcript_25411/g.66504  ORF Transcript_25411/g.66504 Transcript_25411/m.66504 type:complete len:203 (-) Transcript_25411:441-1049(-)
MNLRFSTFSMTLHRTGTRKSNSKDRSSATADAGKSLSRMRAPSTSSNGWKMAPSPIDWAMHNAWQSMCLTTAKLQFGAAISLLRTRRLSHSLLRPCSRGDAKSCSLGFGQSAPKSKQSSTKFWTKGRRPPRLRLRPPPQSHATHLSNRRAQQPHFPRLPRLHHAVPARSRFGRFRPRREHRAMARLHRTSLCASVLGYTRTS